MTIFDRTVRLLQRSLDLRSARQRVIASNLANEETPGYRASELTFMDQSQSAHKGRLPIVRLRRSLDISACMGRRACRRSRENSVKSPPAICRSTPTPSISSWRWRNCPTTPCSTTPRRRYWPRSFRGY